MAQLLTLGWLLGWQPIYVSYWALLPINLKAHTYTVYICYLVTVVIRVWKEVSHIWEWNPISLALCFYVMALCLTMLCFFPLSSLSFVAIFWGYSNFHTLCHLWAPWSNRVLGIWFGICGGRLIETELGNLVIGDHYSTNSRPNAWCKDQPTVDKWAKT